MPLGKPIIFQFILQSFHIIRVPNHNLENFLKCYIFLVSNAVSTGVLRQGIVSVITLIISSDIQIFTNEKIIPKQLEVYLEEIHKQE